MSRTFLSHVAAWVSLATFALVIVGAPTHELLHHKWPGAGLSGKFGFDALRTGRAAKELETTLERQAAITERIRPRYNEAMFLALGSVTPRVTLGEDDWLFLSAHTREYPPEPGVKHLPGTCATVAKLVRWFERNGTAVELMVIPRKATVHPEMLPEDVRRGFRPIYPEIIANFQRLGVSAVDLLTLFQASDARTFLPNDDHWDHPGAALATHEVCERLRKRFAGSEIPGKPAEREITTLPSYRFAGGVVDMLGFTPGGALVERFTVDRTPIVAVDPARPTQPEVGSNTAEDIVVLGSSFSAGFFTASLVSGELGRVVENRARAGHAGGYRVMDLAREILLGERGFPKILVWEFPEEFLVTQVRTLVEPVNSILDVAASPGPLRSERLAIARRVDRGARVTNESHDAIEGVNADARSELVFEFATPLAGDGSVQCSYGVRVANNGVHRVIFDGGDEAHSSPPKELLLLRNELPNRILLPVKSADGSPVKRVRIAPLTSFSDFRLTPLELWRPASAEPGK